MCMINLYFHYYIYIIISVTYDLIITASHYCMNIINSLGLLPLFMIIILLLA